MVKTVNVPWAAWREPEYLTLEFPDSWDINVLRMNGAESSEMSKEDIRKAIINPLGTPRLSEMAQGKERVVIVFDDMTRTTPVSKILPIILEELQIANIMRENITLLAAQGAHRPLNRNDFILKLGEDIVNTMRIENHHPYENLINLGESSIGTPIDINKTYYNSDLKIAISGVIPHLLAGFGGGAKIVLPGVSGIRTLEFNHRGKGGGIGRMTEKRKDIEEIAGKVGLDFSVNVLLNEKGNETNIYSGSFIDAHRKAMEIGKHHYSTKASHHNQICFFNSYPEDSELNQAQYKAFNFGMTAPSNFLDKNGSIVLMTSSYEGRGFHSLVSETGSKLYHNLGESILWPTLVGKRNVFLFSPNVNEYDKNHFFPRSVKLIHKWDELIEDLVSLHGISPKVSIVPCSAQLAV